jgi:hypothetical protein
MPGEMIFCEVDPESFRFSGNIRDDPPLVEQQHLADEA